MVPAGSHHPLRRQRAALRFALLAVLLAVPLPFGSVEPWAVATVEVLAAALGAWGISLLLREREPLPRPLALMLLLALVPVAIGLLQLAPLPPSVLGVVAPRALAMREEVAAVLPETRSAVWPASLSAPDTLDALARYGAWVLIGVAAAAAFRRRSHLRAAAVALAASGCFQALYGSAEYLSGRQHIFGYAKRYYTDVATGTFINRNHFAEYLALALPFALWLASEGGRERPAGSWRQRLVQLAEGPWLARAGGCGAAAAIWAGVLLSGSRGGLAAALVGTALFARSRASRGLRAFALALLLPTAYLCLQEIRTPAERFLDSSEENLATLGGRLPAWEATLGIVRDFPLVGSGIGTFEVAFALYRPPELRGRWDHAHNDWLQALAEGGPLVAAALAGLLFMVSRAAGAASRFTRRPSPGAAALIAALGGGAVHGVVDFGARIPALGVTLAALLGMSAALFTTDRPGGVVGLRAPFAALSVLPLVASLSAATHAAGFIGDAAERQALSAWLAPPTQRLRRSVDSHLRRATAVLNDRTQAASWRLAEYRNELGSVERLLVGSLAASPAQPRALARLAAVRFELDPPISAHEADGVARFVALASRMAAADADLQLLLADACFRMGRPSEGIPYLKRAVELDPSGSAEPAVRFLRENLSSAEEIVEALGTSAPVLVAARGAFEEDGRAPEYLTRLERELFHPTPGLIAAYGETCRRLRAPGRALETFDRLGRLEDPVLEAERLRQRALALLARGERKEALEEAHAAAALQPDGPSFQEFLGQVALSAGDSEKAVKSFRSALRLAARAGAAGPWRARLYRQIGQSEERAGRPDLGYDAYLKALELDPSDSHARERVRQLRQAARPGPAPKPRS